MKAVRQSSFGAPDIAQARAKQVGLGHVQRKPGDQTHTSMVDCAETSDDTNNNRQHR